MFQIPQGVSIKHEDMNYKGHTYRGQIDTSRFKGPFRVNGRVYKTLDGALRAAVREGCQVIVYGGANNFYVGAPARYYKLWEVTFIRQNARTRRLEGRGHKIIHASAGAATVERQFEQKHGVKVINLTRISQATLQA